MFNPSPKDISRGHFYVSLAKSVLRIIAGFSIAFASIQVGGILIILAELLGIIEELV